MVKKCLFPVAGYGTRFLPATKSMPKEMLPVVNKPLVQYGVEEALEAGLFEIAFVTGRGKRAIIDHFDTSYELEHQIAGTDKEKYLVGIRDIIDRAVFSSGATRPALAPLSMVRLQRVMRPSIDRPRMASPANSMT